MEETTRIWNIDDKAMRNYLAVCREASKYENAFETFKANPDYMPIVELSFEESNKYIPYLKRNTSLVLTKIEKLRENDKYGNSAVYNFPIFGRFSPTTIRYIKQSCDILSNFGDEKISSIVELGGGYGGFAKTLKNFIDFEKYSIFDLAEPNALTQKYLSKFNLQGKILSHTLDDKTFFKDKEIDLFISNYAFSELSRSLQKIYIEKVIKKCKMFYISYNTISETSEYDKGINYLNFCQKFLEFDIKIEHEQNGSSHNKVLFGKLKKKL